jgi:ribosomal protein S18 acetylase RimI-like enzyme
MQLCWPKSVPQHYLKKAYDVSAIEANLINPEIIYHIAFDDGIACGYTKLLLQATHPLIETKSIELEKIYVRKNYLGKDAGSLLMKHAINYTKSSGHTTLFLGVWEENKRAVAFYKKFGFEVFTTRTFQLGSTLCDDFMMKLELNQY